MDKSKLGRELRDLRVSLGLTQQQVADRCGISQSHVASYEAGRRPLSESQERRLRAALRRHPSEILRKHAVQVREIAAVHGATQIRAFGSVARGDDRYDSDIDLLVTLRPGIGLFDLVAMREEIRSLLGVDIDLLSDAALRPRDADILAEAVPV